MKPQRQRAIQSHFTTAGDLTVESGAVCLRLAKSIDQGIHIHRRLQKPDKGPWDLKCRQILNPNLPQVSPGQIQTIEHDFSTLSNKYQQTSVNLTSSAQNQQVSDAQAPLWILAATGAIIAGWALSLMDRGLDLSDESYYLNAAIDPWLYSQSSTLVGFVYHYLGYIIGWDVELYRQLNASLTMMLVGLLSYRMARNFGEKVRDSLLFSIAMLPLALAFFPSWVTSPSYNSLVVQGLLIVAIGIIPFPSGRWPCLLQSLTIAVGGWLTLMAKAPTAIAAGIVLFFVLLRTETSWLAVTIAALCWTVLLLFATMIAIDGSPLVFADRMRRGLEMVKLLDGGQMSTATLTFSLSSLLPQERLAIVVLLSISAIWTGLVRIFQFHRAALLAMIGSLAVIFLLLCNIHLFASRSEYGPLILLSPVAGSLAVIIFQRKASYGRSAVVAYAIGLLPFAAAVGTNNNFWSHSVSFAAFWAVAGLLLLLNRISLDDRMVSATALSQVAAVIIMLAAMTSPYRQVTSVFQQISPVSFGPGGHSLLINEEVAAYLSKLQKIAVDAGFKPRDPVIDATGHMPGALFALNAEAIGLAWMIGGYPGSMAHARRALSTVPCDKLADAWVLVEPDGPRRLDTTELISPPFAYETAGSLLSPRGEYQVRFRQELLKPAGDRQTRIKSCELIRAFPQ